MGQSRNEKILENMLGADNELLPPMSRIEKILQNMLGAEYVLDPPMSRNEELLIEILNSGGVGAYDWRGKKVEKVKDLWTYSKTLDQTDFATWTPSTTAIILVPQQYLPEEEIDIESYDYYVHGLIDLNIKYDDTLVSTKYDNRHVAEYWVSTFISEVTDDAVADFPCCQQSDNIYTESGKIHHSFTANSITGLLSGLYPQNTPRNYFMSPNLPNLTITTPIIQCKCGGSASGFKIEDAAHVDQQFSTIKMKIELWRAELGAMASQCSASLKNLIDNPL